jgi:hypothetical protein
MNLPGLETTVCCCARCAHNTAKTGDFAWVYPPHSSVDIMYWAQGVLGHGWRGRRQGGKERGSTA